jgi:hypothetical protein
MYGAFVRLLSLQTHRIRFGKLGTTEFLLNLGLVNCAVARSE